MPAADSDVPKPRSGRAHQIALAYKIERLIETGELRHHMDAVRVSRTRVTQIMNRIRFRSRYRLRSAGREESYRTTFQVR